MTFNIQVTFDTNRERTPQKIINEIIESNHSLTKNDDVFSFKFDMLDFQHAIEILSQVPKDSSVPHLKMNILGTMAILGELSSLAEYFRKFKQEDQKRQSMENFGVGFASLFMNKSFKIDWRDMSYIPKEHFPVGKRVKKADFIGYRTDSRYYFEAKGSTSANYAKIGMKKAKEQLENIRYTAETKMAFVTYIPCDDLDFPPTLFISDPPIEDGIDLDINMVRMLHYQKILYYSGFSTTAQVYSKLVSEIMKNKQSMSEERSFSSIPIEKNLFKIHATFEKESASMERRKINNFEFLGKSTRYQNNNEVYTFFRGVDYNIIKKAVVLEYGINPLHDEVIENDRRKTSIFSDGTIFVVDYENKSKDPKTVLPEKPDPFTSNLKNQFEVTTYEPMNELLQMKQRYYSSDIKSEKTKVPILVRR